MDAATPAHLDQRYETIEEGALSLPAAACRQLDETLGIGATRTAVQLIAAVERLARIEIGTIRIGFTPGQLEELAHRAEKRGHTVLQELQAVVRRIEDEIFHRG